MLPHFLFSTEKPPSTPAPGDGKCLPEWWPYGRYCYFVYNGKQGFSWPESRHYCQLAKAELTSLHSRAEVEFLRNINYTKYHNVWIGLTRDKSCTFRYFYLFTASLLGVKDSVLSFVLLLSVCYQDDLSTMR